MAVSQELKKYLFLGFFICGLIGNSLNLCVLNRKEMNNIQTNTNRFLSAMAIADLGFFLTMLPLKLKTFAWVQVLIPNVHENFVFIVFLIMPIVNFFSTASIWLTIAVSVERMVAVRRPLHMNVHELSAKTRIIFAIVMIFLCAAAVNTYQYVWFRLVYNSCDNRTMMSEYISELDDFGLDFLDVNVTSVDPTNVTEPTVEPVMEEDFIDEGDPVFFHPCNSYSLSDMMDNRTNRNVYEYVRVSVLLFALLVIALPFTLLVGLSAALLYYLKQSGKYIGTIGSSEHTQRIRVRERKVLIMIVVTISTFMVMNFPSGVSMCWNIYYQSRNYEITEPMTKLSEISNILVTLNKACNFVVYCTSSYYFRKQVLQLCLCTRVPFIKRHIPRKYFRQSSANVYGVQVRSRSGLRPYQYSALSTFMTPEGQRSQIRTSVASRRAQVDTDVSGPESAPDILNGFEFKAV